MKKNRRTPHPAALPLILVARLILSLQQSGETLISEQLDCEHRRTRV